MRGPEIGLLPFQTTLFTLISLAGGHIFSSLVYLLGEPAVGCLSHIGILLVLRLWGSPDRDFRIRHNRRRCGEHRFCGPLSPRSAI